MPPQVEWLCVRGKKFPDVLLPYVSEEVRHDLQDRQFYMKQSYQDPTDADGAYYTKHSIANHTLSVSPHSDPHSERLSPRAAENCMVRILF